MSPKGTYNTKSHYGKKDIERISTILETTGLYSVPPGMGKAAAWEIISQIIDTRNSSSLINPLLSESKPTITRRLTLTTIYRAGIAAALALLITIGTVFYQSFSTINMESLYGERISHTLPDGSAVTLNAGSNLHYNKRTWNKERKIYLEGEAFFEVAAGKKFSVITGTAETRVLGTRFNVYARNNDLRVTCYSGKVEVITGSGDRAILRAGNHITGNDMKIENRITGDNPPMNAWINGEFYFHNEPLEKVFAEIGRQFNVTVEYHQSTRRTYTGYFKNNDLQTALELVCIPMQLNFKIIPGERVQIF